MEDNIKNINDEIKEMKELNKKNDDKAKDLLGNVTDKSKAEIGVDILQQYRIPKDEILEIEDWDDDIDVMFPLKHVATLSGKKIYAREMSIKQQSDYIERIKVGNKNNVRFMAETISEFALTEDGHKAFPSGKMEQTLMSKKQDMVTKLYLKIVDAINPNLNETLDNIKK